MKDINQKQSHSPHPTILNPCEICGTNRHLREKYNASENLLWLVCEKCGTYSDKIPGFPNYTSLLKEWNRKQNVDI